MSFLPIVERELRVAARRRGSFWLRLVAALVAALLAGGWLVLAAVLEWVGAGLPPLGRGLFGMLTWLALAAALSAGVFFTSDTISRERREGTLGFLFLTDLRGYDVVLGKLLAASWRAGFALLATMPVLAMTLLLGGVSGGEFWRTVLALGNALFCSLAAGMFVSALCREGQWALFLTLATVVALTAGGPLVDSAVAAGAGKPFKPLLSLTSPGFVFVAANSGPSGDFWRALLVSQAAGWGLLGITCVLTRRVARETAGASWTWLAEARAWWRYGGRAQRAALRRKLLERSPAQWLACRERWQNVVAWAVALVALGALASVVWMGAMEVLWIVWGVFGSVLSFALNVVVASQAGRMLVEARQTGALELLLVSPLSSEQIVRGQWRALLRLFGWPVGLFLAVELAGAFLGNLQSGRVAFAGAAMPVWVGLGIAVAGVLGSVADLAALAWFGMWMGLRSRNVTLATLLTLLWVQVVPWLVIGFVTSIASVVLMVTGVLAATRQSGSPPGASAFAALILVSTGLGVVLTILKDALFIAWSRRKLLRDFRDAAVSAMVPVQPASVRAVAPPVIARTPV